jgi:hypothetical protein
MRKVLHILGLVTGIGPLISALRTRWDDFDAHGRVELGQTATLELPAGEVSIAFESSETGSRGTPADVPTITAADGSEVAVDLMGALQGPSAKRRGHFTDEQIRKRFATAKLPSDGAYTVRAAGCGVLIGSV